MSWRSWWRLLGLGCGCVDRRRNGECERKRVGVEVVDPLVQGEEVARKGVTCKCCSGVVGRFVGGGGLREGCVWNHRTEVLE